MKKINYLPEIEIGKIYYINHELEFYPKLEYNLVKDIYTVGNDMYDVIEVYLFDKDITRSFISEIPGPIMIRWINDNTVHLSDMILSTSQEAKLLLNLEE